MNRKTAPKGWVRITEFETLTGLNTRTVTLAISRGNIPAECWQRIGGGKTSPLYINPQPAALHWYNNINASHHLTRPLREQLAAYISSFNPAAVAPSPEVSTAEKIVPDEKEKKGKKGKATTADNMTFAEAQRRKEVAKALTAELELKEKEGSLISKQKIDEQLFAFGKELRDALLAVPDRITDEVIAAVENRTKVNNIIYNAIAGALEKLADLD